MNDLNLIRDKLRDFALKRDWDKYHTPKNLVMALSVEVSELMEHFQWLDQFESYDIMIETKKDVEKEIADVFIYLIRLADILDIDINEVTFEKIADNEIKYPIDKVKGSAKKYTEYKT